MADRVSRPGRPLLDTLPCLLAASIIAGVVFALPMILSRELFFQDWRHHFYLVAKQARFVESNYSPTFFLNTVDRGWFYPFFAFYGGTLYFLTAVAAILINSPWAAYVGSYALGAALAFGGWLWLAGLVGLRGWVRLLPGIVWISGHYYITNAYGRGAWPEFIAASSVPLALAGVWGNLTRPRLSLASIAGLAAAIVLMTGSHTATLVYSVPFVGLAALGGMLIFPTAVRGVRRIAIVAAISAMAVGVNGWFVGPLLANRHAIRLQPLYNLVWRAFDEYEVIFNLQLVNPYAWSTPQLYVQAPVIPMVVSAAIVLAGMLLFQKPRLIVLGLVLHLAFFVVLDLITQTRLWDWLPPEARVVQFRYRLNTYLLACIVGLVTLAAVYVDQIVRRHGLPGRVAGGLLVLAVLAQFGYGQYQIWTARTYGPADEQLAGLDRLPGTWYERFDYGFTAAPELSGHDLLPLEAEAGSLESRTLWATIPPEYPRGWLARLNVLYSPFIAVEPGDLLVGRSAYYAVVYLPNDRAVDRLTVSYRQTPAAVLGAVISVASILGIVAAMAVVAHMRSRAVAPWDDAKSGGKAHQAPPESTLRRIPITVAEGLLAPGVADRSGRS